MVRESVLGVLAPQPVQSKLNNVSGENVCAIFHETAVPDPGSSSVYGTADWELIFAFMVIPAPPVPTVIPEISMITLLNVMFDFAVFDSGINTTNDAGYQFARTCVGADWIKYSFVFIIRVVLADVVNELQVFAAEGSYETFPAASAERTMYEYAALPLSPP
ncbi:MAG: hypothetical protein G01um101433_144, partial [Parcubacteria group bacterium Gr01-1014_33]